MGASELDRSVYEGAKRLLARETGGSINLGEWSVFYQNEIIIFSNKRKSLSIAVPPPAWAHTLLEFADTHSEPRTSLLHQILRLLTETNNSPAEMQKNPNIPKNALTFEALAEKIETTIKTYGPDYGFKANGARTTAHKVVTALRALIDSNPRYVRTTEASGNQVQFLLPQFWVLFQGKDAPTAGMLRERIRGSYVGDIAISYKMMQLLAEMSRELGLANTKRAEEATYE